MTVVAFDFDGTLSDSEMTVLLGDRRSVAEDMADITDRAMNDEIGYAESLRSARPCSRDFPRPRPTLPSMRSSSGRALPTSSRN